MGKPARSPGPRACRSWGPLLGQAAARRGRVEQELLAVSSSLDRFLLAFRRDLAHAAPHDLDHYADLYWDDRDAFYRAQEDAWATGRPEPYISLTEVRAQNEELSVKTARRLAHRYLAAYRFRQGIEVIQDRRHRLTQDASGMLELARLELGMGHAAAAAAARGQALELDPGLKAEAVPLGEALAAIGAAEAAASSGGWPEARALFDLWIDAGSEQAALGVILRFLTHGRPLTSDDQHDFHHALDMVLSLGRPASAGNLFRALGRQPIYRDHQGAIAAICALLRAGPDETPPIPEARSLGLLGSAAALALAGAGRRRTAITLLGGLSLAYPKAHYLRPALARLVGQDVLGAHPLRYGADGGSRKIFDVFLFNNELRILKMKLHEMADFIDAFVLVEARETFTGAPKPLIFQENREQFAAFADKIVHVVVDRFPDHVRHPWAREYYQRDMGITGLSGRVREDDLVIVSDSDEVVSRDAVQDFDGECAPMGLERMRFFLNYRQALPRGRLKEYPSVWRAGYLRSIGLSSARETLRSEKKTRRISPAGWHFTCVTDAPGIAAKLDNSSHQEHAGAQVADIADMLSRIRAGHR